MLKAHHIGVAALLALLALIVVWHLWWLPPTRIPALLAMTLHALPVLPAVWMLRGDLRRAVFVGAMGALALFSHGVMEAMTSPGARLAGSLEIALSLLLIGAPCWNGLRRRLSRSRAV